MFASFFYFFVLVFGPPILFWRLRRRFPTYKTAVNIAFGLWGISLLPAAGVLAMVAFQVQTLRAEARPGRLAGLECAALIEDAAAAHGLDPLWLGAVVKVESNCNPNAISSEGAQGLTQVMPIIQKWCGLTTPYEPAANLECGSSWLAYLLAKYEGNMDLVLAAYYAGEPAIDACRCVAGHWHYVALVRAAHEELVAASSEPMLHLLQPYGTHTFRIVGNGYHGAGAWPGRDLSAGECGVPVFAPLVGQISEKGVDYLGNTYLVIRQGVVEVMMMHGHYTAEVGDQVTTATRLGYDASEGYSSGCHTHLALHINGRAVDPLPFLEE